MRQSLAIAFVCGLVGGCSLIFNPSNLGKPEDASTIDVSLVRDADPSMLMVLDVEPAVIFGGQGVDHAPPATLVIHGHNFVDGVSVDIEPSTGLHMLGSAAHSFDGDYLVVQIQADVVSGFGSPDVPLTVTVSEPGATPTMLAPSPLVLRNLPTLETTSLSYDKLANTTYARIAIPAGTLTFTGTPKMVTFRSISSVTIGATITAVGGAASGVGSGAAGPGGCPGGTVAMPGGCAIGGGGAATGTAGGGGGGFAGNGGTGGGASDGGMMHGNPAVLNYAADVTHTANQSAGGGGGAGGSLASGAGGGGGGGGGGAIEIDAGGDIQFTNIDVRGGTGGNGSSGLGNGTGGGGGGTGGLVVIRSMAGDLLGGTVDADGGGGGSGGTGTLGDSGGNGGIGAAGRVRADVAMTLPTITGQAQVHRNPTFDPATPAYVTASSASLVLRGTSGESIDLTDYDFTGVAQGSEPAHVMFGTDGTAHPTVSLHAGYNRLCATLEDGVPNTALADTCTVVMYLP